MLDLKDREMIRGNPEATDQDLKLRRRSYIEDLEMENVSAMNLSAKGFHVKQNPGDSNGFSYLKAKERSGINRQRQPDFFISSRGDINDGRIFDHYNPHGGLESTTRGILDKTEFTRQTTRVIVNLQKNNDFISGKFEILHLRNSLRNSPRNEHLEEVYVIHGQPPNVEVDRVFP